MSRKEIKKKAKQYLKEHYWLFVAACLLAAWVGSDFSNVLSPMKLYSTKNIEKTASTSYSSSMLIEGQTANASDAIYEALHGNAEEGRRISDTITADEIQRSETSNHPALGRSRGVFASLLNGIKSGGIVVSVISALDSMDGSSNITMSLLVLLSLAWNIGIWIFFTNVFQVVIRRIFLEARTYKKVPIQRFLFLLRIKKWAKASFTMLLTYIFQLLWTLTIIGGFIKHYSYRLVPYIVAENPDIPATEAITLSRNMMKGHKWECFLFDCSFLGWQILSMLTLGLVGIFYADPYYASALSEYYARLRQEALEKQLSGIQYLNDTYLYQKADEEKRFMAYLEIEDLKTLPVVEIDTIQGFRGFLARTFGLILFPWQQERAYEESRARQIQIATMRDAMDGNAYPTRLFPISEKVKRKRIENIGYMRLYSIWSILLLFFSFSFIGWLWEVSLHLISDGTFVNRGILHGPWLPIYGCGGVLILLVLNKFREHPLMEFIATVVLCGVVEYFTSYYLEMTHDGKKWWDYTGYFLNLHGRICAEGLLVFGLGGLAIVYVIAPLLDNHFRRLKMNLRMPLCIGLLILFLTDSIYSLKNPNEGEGITDYVSTLSVTNLHHS